MWIKTLFCRLAAFLARTSGEKNARRKYKPCDFCLNEKLYRGFSKGDLNNPSPPLIRPNSIRFPDVSCNWSRFSRPIDIRKRENAKSTEGCYSFTVQTSRYRNIATACHDPKDSNYSHVEIRQLNENEDICSEPPKDRKHDGKKLKAIRLEYRTFIANNVKIELEAEA